MTNKTYFHDIFNAIKAMHWRYGVGDIQDIKIFGDGRIELESKAYGCRPHKRRGHLINGRTIKMYRHQMTVTIV